MESKLRKLANLVGGKKGRFVTIGIWILAIIAMQLFLPSSASYKDDTAADLAKTEPSVQADEKMNRYFSDSSGIPLFITWTKAEGLSIQELKLIQDLNRSLTEKPLSYQEQTIPLEKMPPQALLSERSKDGTTFIQTILMNEKASSDQLGSSIDQLKKRTKQVMGENPFAVELQNDQKLIARTTGPAGISVDASGLFKDADVSLLIATVCIVLVILLIIYRSPILALIPLIAVLFAYLALTPLLGLFGKLGWISYSSQGLSIMTVLLFGAGTDYCLFLIARFRHYLKHEQDRFLAFKKSFQWYLGSDSFKRTYCYGCTCFVACGEIWIIP
ncbi:hypothetical protein MFLO_14022 [Listeria floridensis FSL S10-1187]|uniref:Membrane transport protein MMPL domain-containing protein n=1 Tax=Listeria floridensis FSL S10-1187 TaxID=1265817 RepID=A0ABN0RCC3_9LIST|nr:hypothetical protein MFLO_14022 [Listeria floridensis FSL S10-1187]